MAGKEEKFTSANTGLPVHKLKKIILIIMKKIIISIIAIILLFFLYYLVVSSFFPNLNNRGLFGDMFGGINALFSGLAFLGIIYAIVLQKEELTLQRKELELTREELKKSVEAQQKSEQALTKQVDSMKKTAKLNGLSTLLNYESKTAELKISTQTYGYTENTFVSAKAVAEKIKEIIKDD